MCLVQFGQSVIYQIQCPAPRNLQFSLLPTLAFRVLYLLNQTYFFRLFPAVLRKLWLQQTGLLIGYRTYLVPLCLPSI